MSEYMEAGELEDLMGVVWCGVVVLDGINLPPTTTLLLFFFFLHIFSLRFASLLVYHTYSSYSYLLFPSPLPPLPRRELFFHDDSTHRTDHGEFASGNLDVVEG